MARHAPFQHFSRMAGAAILLLGLLVLAGWALDVLALKSVVPGLATMKPMTATGFALAGLALWLLQSDRPQAARGFGQLCGVTVAALGGGVLGEYLLGWDLGIDLLQFSEATLAEAKVTGTPHPGRMAPATAMMFLALGCALALLRYREQAGAAHIPGIAGAVLALIALSGYLFGAESLYSFAAYISVAAHTSAAHLVLALGILCAYPDEGAMKIVSGDGAGSVMVRRLLPAVIVVPWVLAWFRWQGELAGLYATGFGLALFAVSIIIVLAVVVLWTAIHLNHTDTERKEADEKVRRLNRVYAVLSGINTLIVRVQDRQELFSEACRIAVDHGNFGMAWIGMLDSTAQEVTPVAWAGLGTDQYLGNVKFSIRDDLPTGRGVLGRAVRSRKAAYDNDITIEPEVGDARRQEAIRRGYRSVIVLPLMVEDKVIGRLSLFAKESNFFTEEEIRLLTELANDISFALENIAKHQKLEKLSRIRAVSSKINAAIVRIRDRQALFEEVCRIAAELGNFTAAWIGTIDPATREVRHAASVGLDPQLMSLFPFSTGGAGDESRGTISRALHTRKPVWENDFEADPDAGYSRRQMIQRGYRSAISLPLLVDEDAQGVLVLYARERGYFTEDEVGMLTELAADVSFALQSIAQQERLDYVSYYDTVTGLPNRSLFLDRAGQQMRSRGGESHMVALIVVNLERFRNINETFGRRGGDALLKLVASRLEAAFHGKDYIARVGADNFGVVMRGMRDAAVVVHAIEDQILACFGEPFQVNDTEIRVAARAGVAMFPADGAEVDTLFANSDAALKKARVSGERFLFYAAEMNARAAQIVSLETRLRKAVEAREFVLHYQTKIDLATGAVCGLEALIRWQEPGAGLVAPGMFIPLLEETGLILPVGKWAIGRALSDHREWTARGCKVPRIAVNVSTMQLQQRDFADTVIHVVQQHGDNPDALELEVTESMFMRDIEGSIRKLSVLRGLGIHVAMDDFGTGYSSLNYLARLPISSIKIDRSFITGVTGNPQDMSIVTTIIALAHSLNLRVVAEGVETVEQSKLLKLLKCEEAQGYLFSKPLPGAEIERMLRAQAADNGIRGRGKEVKSG